MCRYIQVSACRFINISECRFIHISECRFIHISECRYIQISECRYMTYAFIAIVRSSHFGFKFLFLKLPEFCSTMEKADILKLPPLDEIAVTKNKENYWVPDEEDYYLSLIHI